MATISLSTAYASRVTNEISNFSFLPQVSMAYTGDTGTSAANSFSNFINDNNTIVGPSFGSILHRYATISGGGSSSVGVAGPVNGIIRFKNSSNVDLTTYSTAELTRTIDTQGYLVLANFPPKIPTTAGRISTIVIEASTARTITLTVGAPGGTSDVQFDDRDLVTTQPWRLDGSIRFRVPISYEYTL
jgi:hypothetical protein